MKETEAPYVLTLEERKGYLYALIKADTMTHDMAISYLSEIANRCNDTRCDRVLIERDVPAMLSTGDLFFTTQEFVKMMPNRRVAFINPHLSNENAIKFALMIGNNRGAKFELHSTIASAEKWLLGCIAMMIDANVQFLASHFPAAC